MRKVLVTGGAGKLGRIVCAELAPSCDITVFDRVKPSADVRSLEADIRDAVAVRRAAHGQAAIIHLAGIPSPRHGSPEEILSTNALGTWTVLDAARRSGVQRVVLCSSDFVTGLLHQPASVMPLYLPIDEAHPVAPRDAYGLSKQLCEDTGHCFARLDVEVVILRPGLIVFPDMEHKVGAWGADVANPDLWWYAAAADVAVAFRLALALPSVVVETFFIGAPNTLSTVPTLDLVQRRYGRLPEIRQPDVYRNDPHAALFDTSRARRVLGFSAQTDWKRWVKDPPGS